MIDVREKVYFKYEEYCS